MLYIAKNHVPDRIQEQIIQIEKTDEWKNIKDDDVKRTRTYFDKLDKSLIREALVKEQHGLCAYCMKRIQNTGTTTIEHYKPIRNKSDALNYKNMLGCCDGGRQANDGNKVLCCDAAKGDKEISIGPLDKDFVDKIRYTKDGFIYTYPNDDEADRQINEILHLNGILNKDGTLKRDTSTQLVAGRRSTYKNFTRLMESLGKKKAKGADLSPEINKMIKQIEESEEYPEFAGVLLYFLRRRVRNG
jgi:uncharacterized protein (TIGR02646 family)